MAAGTVVYLNGPSSSGKHGIVAALQEIMDAPWFNVGIDQWFYNFPAQYIGSRPRAAEGFPWTFGADGRLIKTGVGPYGRRLMRGSGRWSGWGSRSSSLRSDLLNVRKL